jgi:hypothetical protein
MREKRRIAAGLAAKRLAAKRLAADRPAYAGQKAETAEKKKPPKNRGFFIDVFF